MILYHSSDLKYNIGDIITLLPGEDVLYYKNADSLQRDVVNRFDQFIDANYPTYLHRRNALFASDNQPRAFGYNPRGWCFIL